MLEVGDLTSLAVNPSAVGQWMRQVGGTDANAGGSGRPRSSSLSTCTGGGGGLWCYYTY